MVKIQNLKYNMKPVKIDKILRTEIKGSLWDTHVELFCRQVKLRD